jgi:hypothetical protein
MKHLFQLVFLFCVVSAFAQAPWPGQSGNAIGYAAYGSLNAAACGSFSSGSSWSARTTVSNCTYSSYQTINCNYCEFDSVDFKGTGTTAGTLISGSNVLFKGCRFQSNDVGNYNVQTTGANIYFVLPSVTPLASFYTAPPGAAWPSASAGTNVTTMTEGVNTIYSVDAYEYGINVTSGGPVYVTGADIWGFGNAIVFYSTTAQMTVVNSWIHDAACALTANCYSSSGYHQDGIGYLNSGTGPTNVITTGNTIASLGDTNAIAFQGGTAGLSDILVDSNYLAGFGYTAFLYGWSGSTGNGFGHNVIGTDIAEQFGPLYNNTTNWGTAYWGCNTISFLAGTTWVSSVWTPTSGMGGQYWVPSSTPNSATDQGSNTHCGNLSKSSLLWLPGNLNKQSFTLTAGNTGNLGSISIGLATGTQFSQVNNCGSTLANGASCTITVTYTPTGTGPVADTLQITDNDPSSPELVPLLGIDTPSASQTHKAHGYLRLMTANEGIQ